MKIISTLKAERSISQLLGERDVQAPNARKAVESLRKLGPAIIPKIIEAFALAGKDHTAVLVQTLSGYVSDQTLKDLVRGLSSDRRSGRASARRRCCRSRTSRAGSWRVNRAGTWCARHTATVRAAPDATARAWSARWGTARNPLRPRGPVGFASLEPSARIILNPGPPAAARRFVCPVPTRKDDSRSAARSAGERSPLMPRRASCCTPHPDRGRGRTSSPSWARSARAAGKREEQFANAFLAEKQRRAALDKKFETACEKASEKPDEKPINPMDLD